MKKTRTNLFFATRSVVQRGIVAILCTFIFGLFLIAGCKKDNGNNNEVVEVPFTEYLLGGTSCQWKNLSYDKAIIVINNKEKLENYLDFSECSYPEVDFSKHSLLLVSGSVEDGGISGITKKLQRLSTNEYELEVELVINPAKQEKEWVLALIIEKLNEESSFKLTVTTSYEEPEYPMNIPFTEYSLNVKCNWTNLAYDNTVIIINSEEEMNQNVKCKWDSYDEIDFSKHSLLLMSGKTDFGIMKITVTDLQQLSEDEYELNMEILLSDVAAPEEWDVALIIEKVRRDSNFKLNVTEYHPTVVPFEEYYMYCGQEIYGGHPCWKNLYYDNDSTEYTSAGILSVINSNEDLENHLICPEDYPSIDFSRHTLLLASGFNNGGGSKILYIGFFKYNSNQYALGVRTAEVMQQDGGLFIIAILVPKIEDKKSVTFKRLY